MRQSLDGALLRRDRDAGRHRPVRGERNDAAAGAFRRAGSAAETSAGKNAIARAPLDEGLPAARVLVRADVPQACRQALRRAADSRRRRGYDQPRSGVAPARSRLQGLRALRPDYELWRDFPYEYERGRLAIDLINGSELLREWSTIAPRRPRTSKRSPAATSKRGSKSARRCCSIAEGYSSTQRMRSPKFFSAASESVRPNRPAL